MSKFDGFQQTLLNRLQRIGNATDAAEIEHLQREASVRFATSDLDPQQISVRAIEREIARREWLACELRKHELTTFSGSGS